MVGSDDNDDDSGLTWTEGGTCHLEVVVLNNGIRLRFKIQPELWRTCGLGQALELPSLQVS